MSSASLNDVITTLTDVFSQSECSPAALDDVKPSLSSYVLALKNRKGDADVSTRLQEELQAIFKKLVEPYPKKLGPFLTVLKHLRPAIITESDLVYWFNSVIIPFTYRPGALRCSTEDAELFVISAMVYDDDAADAREKTHTCSALVTVLLDAYMDSTSISPASLQDDQDVFAQQDNHSVPLQFKGHAALQLQKLLVAFGRKKAKDLFLAIDHYLVAADTRFRALTLLTAFVEQQQAHLYLVVHTSVVENLLKCLMNDTATIVVSAALRCLIMLLPHIPATVATQLPRLFLIYSRCLCWEKFSASSTKAQRDLVTDDRVRRGSDSEPEDGPDVDIDPTWATLHPVPDMPESSAPEILHYFTYLYGLYPLNFLAYVRKPRKYLKNLDFPGADDFDLDQAIIRSRTEQFQRVHLLHPSFFKITLEDELAENRWLKAEPSEVIAECHGLYVGQSPVVLASPGPPPSGSLPDLPTLPPLDAQSQTSHVGNGAASPKPISAVPSNPTSPVTAESPTPAPLPAGDSIVPSASASNDVVRLQRELLSLRNEFVFERHLKQQYVAAIGQLRRNHIKAVTIEAETATLINANRALQKKLGDAIKFNEKMQKETQARRTHTKQSEEQLTAKIRSLKADLTNQESIQRDLQQAKKDCLQLRQLLVESEARELVKQEEIENLQGSVQEVEKLQREISELSKQIRMHRQRELHSETTQAEQQMTKQELDSAKMLLKHRDQELERSKKALHAKIVKLETSLELVESNAVNSSTQQENGEYIVELETMLANTRLKLSQTNRAYSQLLNDYTDLKIRHQELFTESDSAVESQASLPMQPSENSLGYEYRSQDGSLQNYISSGTHLPSYPKRGASPRTYPQAIPASAYPPARPIRADIYSQRMMNASPQSHNDSVVFSDGYSRGSATWGAAPSMLESEYGLAPPGMMLGGSKSAFSINSEDSRGTTASKKIKAKSEARVYGRGGAQNIKMKNKDKAEKEPRPVKSGGMQQRLRGIM